MMRAEIGFEFEGKTGKGEMNKMNITYHRDVEHCSKSNYVKMVTIKEVNHAVNSDNLDVIRFVESGWQAVVKRDGYKVGDQVCFIPPESMLPVELSDALGITTYLSKSKVKVAKLRGNRSEGLVVDYAAVGPYLDYIKHWEDLPDVQMAGEALPHAQIPHYFVKFYKMPNLMNEPDTFRIGERVYYSEKRHGTSCKLGCLKNPQTEEYQLYVASMNTVLKDSEGNLYWRTVRETLGDIELPKDYIFYGEIYGLGVQDMQYGLKKQTLDMFNVWFDWNYIDLKEGQAICNSLGLPFIQLHEDEFQGLDWARDIADSPSELYNGFREGIVLVSAEDPNRMAKVIGNTYLSRKKGTERH